MTLVGAFLYLSLFSWLVTVCADMVVEILESPDIMGFLGLAVVAAGAEIPDGVQAVTAARRGYASMSTSSCIGSQCCNLCVGLGLPWLVSLLYGTQVTLGKSAFVAWAATVQTGVVVLFMLAAFAPVLASLGAKVKAALNWTRAAQVPLMSVDAPDAVSSRTPGLQKAKLGLRDAKVGLVLYGAIIIILFFVRGARTRRECLARLAPHMRYWQVSPL